MQDLDVLSFIQNHVEREIRTEARVAGLCDTAAELAGLLGALVRRRGFEAYQIDQRHLARKLSCVCKLKIASRQQISKMETVLQQLGYLEIPSHVPFFTGIKTKIRKFTQKFIDLVLRFKDAFKVDATPATYLTSMCDNSLPATDSCTEYSKDYSKETVRTIFNSNPIRVCADRLTDAVRKRFARPSRATLFDSNHIAALAKRGIVQERLSRVDRQFIFHTQKAIEDDAKALAFFVDTVRAREEGDSRIVQFFADWKSLPKGRRTAAVVALCGGCYENRRLSAIDRQFLYYVQKVTPTQLDSIKAYVDITRLRHDGDELVVKFFKNWGDLTKWSKPGQVANLLRAIRPPPVKEFELPGGVPGEDSALDFLPRFIEPEELSKLIASLSWGYTYAGKHADILTRLRAMSTLECNICIENLVKRSHDVGH